MRLKQRVNSLDGLDAAAAAFYEPATEGFVVNFDKYSAAMEQKLASMRTDFDILQVMTTAKAMAKDLARPGSESVLVPLIAKRLRGQEGDGCRTLVVVDTQGRPSALNLADLRAEIVNDPAFRPVLDVAKSSQTPPVTVRSVMRRAEWEALDSKARAEFFRAGGQLQEDPVSAQPAGRKLPAGTLDRASFDALGPRERAAHFQDGGKLVDD